MRISDWSSDVCSSDLTVVLQLWTVAAGTREGTLALADRFRDAGAFASASESTLQRSQETLAGLGIDAAQAQRLQRLAGALLYRSEEHTSELQSLMRNSYAVFCLKKKTRKHTENKNI